MNPYTIRAELKKMKREDLFKLTDQQKKRWCNIGASECRYFVEHKGFNFCLKEVSGQRCSRESGDHAEAEDS
jgi:hypothetical protein